MPLTMLCFIISSISSTAAFSPTHTRHVTTSIPITSSTSLKLGDFFNSFGKETKDNVEAAATSEESEQDDEYYDEDDPIEKIFGVFFGKKEKNPMGMSRFGRERFPEQYPPTINEWADPVDGDTAEMALLRPFLKNTNLESRGLRLTYDANRDGWDPVKFHGKVDRQGGGIVYGVTRGGIQFGGYNPKGWVSTCTFTISLYCIVLWMVNSKHFF